MKPQSSRTPDAHPSTDSTLVENRAPRDRGMHAVDARPPPAVPYRRYPSLSDDALPYRPRLRRTRRNADETVTAVNAATEDDRLPFFSVRMFAFLVIVVIIAALIANA